MVAMVTAPTLMSVMFDPSYAELWVQFDREVEVGGEHDFNTTTPPSCDLLFDPPTLSILSSTSKCKWKNTCLLYTSPSPRDRQKSRMPSSA